MFAPSAPQRHLLECLYITASCVFRLSLQTLYDPFFISFYNLFYTSLPVLAMGIFDQVW